LRKFKGIKSQAAGEMSFRKASSGVIEQRRAPHVRKVQVPNCGLLLGPRKSNPSDRRTITHNDKLKVLRVFEGMVEDVDCKNVYLSLHSDGESFSGVFDIETFQSPESVDIGRLVETKKVRIFDGTERWINRVLPFEEGLTSKQLNELHAGYASRYEGSGL